MLRASEDGRDTAEKSLPPPPFRRCFSSSAATGNNDGRGHIGHRNHTGVRHVQCLLGDSLDVEADTNCTLRDDSLPCLVLGRMEKLPLKDFSSEIRASLDIEKFLKEAVLMLDVDGTTMEAIVESMLRNIFKSEDIDGSKLDQLVADAKKSIFMQATCLSYTYQRLAKTIKGISLTDDDGLATDQSWVCTMCSLPFLKERRVAVARLRNPVNMGKSSEGVFFIILILTPTKEKGTKSEIEIGRTFSTILADVEFRQQLLYAETEDEFKTMLQEHANELAKEQKLFRRRSLKVKDVMDQTFSYDRGWCIANGIRADLKKRIPVYGSDFKDGLSSKSNVRKMISATTFLYFACLLPTIAFGVLNSHNTKGKFNVQRVIMSQGIGGVMFAVFGGQPLIVMLTTAPLALYIKVIYDICEYYDLDFFAMYGWVGLFNALYLIIYAIVDLSKLMKWSTRSTEEIFAFFISIAFFVDACKDIGKDFTKNYFGADCIPSKSFNISDPTAVIDVAMNATSLNATKICTPENSVLFLLLTIGTVWLALYLLNFTNTPFLNKGKRELMADFALPVSVLLMSFFGSFVFRAIKMDTFAAPVTFNFKLVVATPLHWTAIAAAAGIAFPLSLLFFMDQNISSAMVNNPTNKLKKGSAYHWDLLVVAVINTILSLIGLPWVHGALPHSPMHVKALADVEDRIDIGHHLHQTIVRVRETRLTGIFSNILIAVSLLMLPYPLGYIPTPVLDGLFIYMAVTALYENQLFERLLLLFTEQAAYPPSHYLRRVPQRKVHLFTALQLIQLGVLCSLGFAPTPYAKMGFPIILMLQLPIRHKLLPLVMSESYLDALDKPM